MIKITQTTQNTVTLFNTDSRTQTRRKTQFPSSGLFYMHGSIAGRDPVAAYCIYYYYYYLLYRLALPQLFLAQYSRYTVLYHIAVTPAVDALVTHHSGWRSTFTNCTYCTAASQNNEGVDR